MGAHESWVRSGRMGNELTNDATEHGPCSSHLNHRLWAIESGVSAEKTPTSGLKGSSTHMWLRSVRNRVLFGGPRSSAVPGAVGR